MRRISLLCFLFFALALHTEAQSTYATRVLKDSLFIPWEILYGPDDHIWFTQKNGFICRMDNEGKHVDTLYHEPQTVTIKESGMLGMALHPDFDNYPYVYVVWEYLDSPWHIRERVWRYTYNKSANILRDPKLILDSVNGYIFHNGCRLAIVGDKMFISVADAEDFSAPQNVDSINGKILRINLDGSIPDDNPIPGNAAWSWGHRNPQGLVYANGILYSSEHGPETDDEFNIIQKGRNYGWPVVRGYCDLPGEMDFCRDSNVAEPLHAWTPTIAPCGIDYYDHQMFPELRNSILMTTLKDKHLYQLKLSETHDAITSISTINAVNYGRLRDICISPEGRIFLSTSNSVPNDTAGQVDRIIEVYNPDMYHKDSFTLSPNPASSVVYISTPVPYKRLHYTLTTFDGRKIAEDDILRTRPQINVGPLPAGIYNLRATTDNGDIFNTSFVRQN